MKILKWLGLILLLLMATGTTFYMIYVRPFMQKMNEVSIVKYDKDLTLVFGGGGNSGILVSDSLVLVIDTKMGDAAEQLSGMVKVIAGNKPVLIVNTHYHPDHSKGNNFYKGQSILAGGNYTEDFWKKEASEQTMPTRWLKDRMVIRMGDETVTLLNLGRDVHTSSDVVVYLQKRKMLFTGDVVLNHQVPVVMGTADPDGYVWAFDMFPKQFDIQKIVPGHGSLGGPEVIDTFRQYFTDMKIAATDESKKDELVQKYKDWNQLPIVMSPGATIRAMKKKN